MLTNKKRIKSVMDIGNSKIKILVGSITENTNEIEILGFGEAPTLGLKRALIEDPEKLTLSIKEAIKSVEEKIGRKISKITAGISSPHIRSVRANGSITFPECEISKNEVDDFFSEVEGKILKKNERVIKREMYNIRVNRGGIVKNPLGEVGRDLQADVHLICIDEAEYSAYEEVINRAELIVEEITLNSYGSAESVLNESEKKSGVSLIDIGEGITDILIFKNNKLIYSKSIPLGGIHYIGDISYLLQITREEARIVLEKLRNKEFVNKNIFLSENKKFEVSKIKDIIDARTEDIANFIMKTIEESGFKGYLGKGIVITGGVIILDEIMKKISEITRYVVVKKNPLEMKGLRKSEPYMASIIGTMNELLKKEYYKQLENRKNIKVIEEKIEVSLPEKEEEDLDLKKLNLELKKEEVDLIENKNKIETLENEKKGIIKKTFEWLSNYI
jgi:cell division protein FtsA